MLYVVVRVRFANVLYIMNFDVFFLRVFEYFLVELCSRVVNAVALY